MFWRNFRKRMTGLLVPVFAGVTLILSGIACGFSPQPVSTDTPMPTSPPPATPTSEPPTAVPSASPDEPRTLVLTRSQPSASAEGELVAPGREKQKYTLFLVDTRDFQNGGTITFEITLGTGESDASFDLFPEGVPIPTEGRALDSVATLYDLPRGSSGTMSYTFAAGQVFQFGASGNWFSPEGTTNTFTFTVTVK
ncbi:MAG: hypothetical protein HND47_03465 [Chloroflexi bacterium]|nr:hypothetical protein [Chloroflexota bacterium]